MSGKPSPTPARGKPLKQPFYITRSDGLPLTFAGLWEKWKDGLLSCAILTTDADDITRDIHVLMPDRKDGQFERFKNLLRSAPKCRSPAIDLVSPQFALGSILSRRCRSLIPVRLGQACRCELVLPPDSSWSATSSAQVPLRNRPLSVRRPILPLASRR